MTWIPIESAPKDGTVVLLYGAKARYKVVTAKWAKDWNSWLSQPGGWSMYPTHWMPLPPPPVSRD